MNQRPTISDVAREAGVSKASVSAVLNDKGGVSETTRARILNVCARLNYRPSGLARTRGVARHRRTIGLVIKELDNPYFMEVAAGALNEGRKHGYTVWVASSEGEYAAEKESVEQLCEKGVDGLIINPVLGGDADLSHLFDLRRRNVPFVLLEALRGVPASLVDIENVDASRRAVEHLLELGHQRIIHFAGPEHSIHSEERIEGIRHAFSRSPLSFPDTAIVPAGAHLEDGYRAGIAYFRECAPEERPTAATCYNDLVALGLLRALTELGLGVPQDVSVVGFDDLELLEYLPVPLTTVHVPKYEMGRRAVEMLVRHIENREQLPAAREYLTGQLIVRSSTRAMQITSSPAQLAAPVG